MKANKSDTAQLSIDEKRQIVFASLLKYSPEAASLRHRVLDKVILGALVGSTRDKPYQANKIYENVHFLKNGPSLRENVIHETLLRLKHDNRIGIAEKRSGLYKKRNVYWLTDKGLSEINETVEMTSSIFDAAFKEMLGDSAEHFSYEQGAMLCRRILLLCFARLGRSLAKCVTEETGFDGTITSAQITNLVSEAVHNARLTAPAKESLSARILLFFKSQTPAATHLKYYLSQGFYFTELLGFEDSGGLNPLSEQCFNGSVFVLDANVVLLSIFEGDRVNRVFEEVASIAGRIGITLVVTRATLNEVRRTAVDHVGAMRKFLGVIPGQLVERADDQFLSCYLRMKEGNAALQIDDYLALFLSIEYPLQSRWGVQIDEREEEGFDPDAELEEFMAGLEKATNNESEAIGFKKKAPTVLEHDLFNCALVALRRRDNRKTWFLTDDRVLARASKQVAGLNRPVCFSLVGFLHSISPFVARVVDQPFADVLSDVLDLRLTPSGIVYDVKELALIAEMHSDVLATPESQLVMALDYVKSHELNGEVYDIADYGKVSLGLKKFLTSTKDEQIRAYEKEALRLEAARAEAALERERADLSLQGSRQAVSEMQKKLEAASQDRANLEAQIATIETTKRRVRIAAWSTCLVLTAWIAIQRDAVLVGASITPSRGSALITDVLCIVALLLASRTIIRLLVKSALVSLVYRSACLFVLAGFIFLRDFDPDRLNGAIDLAVKCVPIALFLFPTRRLIQPPQS